MIGTRLRISGIDKIKEKVAAASRRGGNLVQFTEYVAARAYKECMKHFRDEAGPDGAWAPLSPATILRRRQGRGSGGAKALRDTGRLWTSILFRGTRDAALVFTNVRYGAAHQYGAKNIPKREFLWVDEGFLGKMAGAFEKFIRGNIK